MLTLSTVIYDINLWILVDNVWKYTEKICGTLRVLIRENYTEITIFHRKLWKPVILNCDNYTEIAITQKNVS